MADLSSTRRYERIEIALHCRLFITERAEGRRPPRLQFEAFATSQNLGLGGLLLRSDFQLKPGLEVTVELGLPNGPLPIVSRVAHNVDRAFDDPPGFGIEFLNVDAHGRETLLRYFTPPAYVEFHRAMAADFPHLADDFALEDVSLLLNLWEEDKARRADGLPPKAAPEAARRRTPRPSLSMRDGDLRTRRKP